MQYLRTLGLAVLAATALTAILGAGTASATQLYKYTTPSGNDKIGVGTVLDVTLESGASLLIKDTGGGANDTCIGHSMSAKIEKDTTTGVRPQGKVTAMGFGGCSHKTSAIALGELEFQNIAGTTNGVVISRNMEVTFFSTVFGISCIAKTGAGTSLGTLTGAKSSTGQATMHLVAVIPAPPLCGDSTWTGSYAVTSPLGLTVEAS